MTNSCGNKKMKKVLLHIGSGKTGTSSIQNALAAQSCSDGVPFHYPIISGNGNQSLEVVFKPYERLSRGLKTRFERNGGYEKFKDFYTEYLSKHAENNNLLLSSEFMFNFNLDEIFKLREFFEERQFSCFKIALYLRDPASYYMSLVQQKLKASYTIPCPLKFNPKYMKFISNWIKVFGGDLCTREFNRKKMLNGNILDDFSIIVSEFFGKKVLLASDFVNESISAEGMKVLQEFRKIFFQNEENRFAKESTRLLKKIVEIENTHPGTKPKLKEYYEEIIKMNCISDILALKSFGVFVDFKENTEIDKIEDSRKVEEFSGDVVSLLDSFDPEHFKYLLYRISFDSCSNFGGRVKRNRGAKKKGRI